MIDTLLIFVIKEKLWF